MTCIATVGIWSARVFTALALCLGIAATTEAATSGSEAAVAHPSPAKNSLIRASVYAQPGLLCKLFPESGTPSAGVPVYTDDDGYARFYALRMAAGSPKRRQVLDCADDNGKRSTFPVDLASDETFARRPVDLAGQRGRDRPPLSGDPFSYSQAELIEAGYGLRPDPAEDSAAYISWLTAASRPGRMLEAKRADAFKHERFVTQAPQWTGSVLTGVPPYVSIQGMVNVPTAIPGGDQTTNTVVALWNGLGGYQSGSGLIQSGVTLFTTPTTANYLTWREYCCGDPNSNGYGGAFVPNPGDTIYIQNWYCDAQGRPSLNGGFGCSFLHDLDTAAILSCTSATGRPCWSVPALPLCSDSPAAPNCMTLGLSAEFIIEHQSDQLQPPLVAFTDFTPTVRMTGSAQSSGVAVVTPFGSRSQNVGSDPAVFVLTDFTNSTTRMDVTLGERDSTCFTIYRRLSFPRPNPAPAVRCPSTPLPPGKIDLSRREELVAVILFGIIHDEGGVAIVGGKLLRIPPRGPITETLAALPPALRDRLAPLLRDLPQNGEAANRLATQLTAAIAGFRQQQLSRGRQP
jgi:hypothetical protein